VCKIKHLTLNKEKTPNIIINDVLTPAKIRNSKLTPTFTICANQAIILITTNVIRPSSQSPDVIIANYVIWLEYSQRTRSFDSSANAD
jgi:hypothetical protein